MGHWGPQCEAEHGDWYARGMYEEGTDHYRYHVQKYGNPSKFGFKDVIHQWKAERWDPDELLALYKKAGARYFMAMANHHDNLDLYKSRYQPEWNSTTAGPGKDLIGGWSRAARANGMRFGVSVHAARTWIWFEDAQGADKSGPYAGIADDGKLTSADGKGTWWEGRDPQALYAQNHARGVAIPDKAYCDKFFDRTRDLIDNYDPDMVYYDDAVLPLFPFCDAGLRLTAHMYNRSIAKKGRNEAVVNGKIAAPQHGVGHRARPEPPDRALAMANLHLHRQLALRPLAVRAQGLQERTDGGADADRRGQQERQPAAERAGARQRHHRRAGARHRRENRALDGGQRRSHLRHPPRAVYGEGPVVLEAAMPKTGASFTEGKGKPLTAADVRFTAKGKTVFAFVMGWPASGQVSIAAMGSASPHLAGPVQRVELLGSKRALAFEETAEGLLVTLPANMPVREAMGGTGSKSTIAPMLKQWKAQHESEVATAGAGLPADLLEAVQEVYERVQESAKFQVEQLRAEHQLAAQEAARLVEALQAEGRQLGAEREALAGELASLKAKLAHEQAARQKDAVAIAALESEKDGLAQRLADRAAEVRTLADQLAQARRQFEHFQEASATQRQDDKSAYEARIARTEQEAATLRTYVQDSREALAVLRSEKVHLEYSLSEQLGSAREQKGKLYDATEALTVAREMASSRQFEMEMAEERLGHAQQANERLEARLAELESKNVMLKTKMAASAPKARGRKM